MTVLENSTFAQYQKFLRDTESFTPDNNYSHMLQLASTYVILIKKHAVICKYGALYVQTIYKNVYASGIHDN